jgi:hypothetical protein
VLTNYVLNVQCENSHMDSCSVIHVCMVVACVIDLVFLLLLMLNELHVVLVCCV